LGAGRKRGSHQFGPVGGLAYGQHRKFRFTGGRSRAL
jgi:hypothetical protein